MYRPWKIIYASSLSGSAAWSVVCQVHRLAFPSVVVLDKYGCFLPALLPPSFYVLYRHSDRQPDMSEITAGYVHGMAKPFGPAPFGPSDFVIAFGQLCSLVPAAVIILNMPFYCFRAFRPARYTSLSLVLALKILMVGVLGATQINIVRGWWATSPPAGRLTQAAALASYASMPCMGLMVYFNHLHFVPSSPFLTAFMVITSLVDLGPFPTYFCPENSMENYRTFATLKLLVLLVEQLPKGPIIYQENEPLESQQQRSNGIMDTPLAKWLKSDVFFGFRLNIKKENPVDFTHEFDPAALHSRFSAQWNKCEKSRLIPANIGRS